MIGNHLNAQYNLILPHDLKQNILKLFYEYYC